MSFIKNWFFPAFLLFTILAEPIFHAYMSVRGITVESGMLSLMFMGIFAVSMLVLIKDMSTGSQGLQVRKVLMIMVAVVCLYYLSSVFQTFIPAHYHTYLLVFGSKSIPACIIGMHIARDGDNILRRVDMLLPFFIIGIGIILGLLGYQAAMMGEILRNDDSNTSSLNYQVYSYYMAEFYVYSAYYLFFSSSRGSFVHKLFRFPIVGCMLFFAACCLMGGGRGAFVFIILATAFVFYEMRKVGRMSNKQIGIVLVAIGVAFAFVAVKLNIFESTGFDRVLTHIAEDDSRKELRDKALYSFWNSPLLGHGLGSVWWEVGFYSHNMVMDALVEAGLVGLVVLLSTGFTMFKRMFVLCRYNTCYFFLMLMFCEQALKGVFTGYYIGLYHLWLILGLTFAYPKSYFTRI